MKQNTPLELEIDQTRLNEECVLQPKLIYNACVALSESRARLEQARIKTEIAEAELDRTIRKSPERYGIEKITETAVKNLVVLKSAEHESTQEFYTVKEHVDLSQAYVTALEHKKRMLELLVQLHGQQYFAVPKVDEDTQDTIKQLKARELSVGKQPPKRKIKRSAHA